MDWLNHIDIKRALYNCRTDIFRDWYYDPWGWPELGWIVEEQDGQQLLERLNGTGAGQAAKLEVPKANFGVRPALVVGPIDRLVYQSLVDTVSKSAIGDMKELVFGWRLVPRTPKKGEYARNDWQWENYRAHLRRLANESRCLLRSDIVSFFASIPVPRIMETLSSRAGSGKVVKRIGSLLEGWDSVYLRSGLPQRFFGSAVLANMYVGPLDDVLATFKLPEDSDLAEHFDSRAVRWMDDIWLFGNDARELRKAQLTLSSRMQELDLNMNYGKTDVVEGASEVIEAVAALEHGYVDVTLDMTPPRFDVLKAQIEGILRKPAHADRTTVHFVTKRLRNHKLFDYVDPFVKVAEDMPHVADHLARLFRDSGAWRKLESWFVEYALLRLGQNRLGGSELRQNVSELRSRRWYREETLRVGAIGRHIVAGCLRSCRPAPGRLGPPRVLLLARCQRTGAPSV